ncbi:MAG: phosphate ABC transporter permease PstA [Pseudomonadales bacterium]|nr:phosphate ABC transporter permease PstA [Pseudomonadales bacterium]
MMSKAMSQGDRIIQMGLCCPALIICGVFVWLLFDVVSQGISGLSWQFLTQLPADAGRAGGIVSIIVSTFIVLIIALLVALPIGLGTAIWLAEFADEDQTGMAVAVWVRRSLQLLAGVPSIVVGLFGYAVFCQLLGLGYSLLAGGLTLGCMILPLLIGSLEAGLRAVPCTYRINAVALGLSKFSVIRRILLPQAAPALLAGLILSIGRALAETAALLFTSGYVTRMPESVYDSGRVLSVHVFDLAMNVPGGDKNAYATALVLLLGLLLINSVLKKVVNIWAAREN